MQVSEISLEQYAAEVGTMDQGNYDVIELGDTQLIFPRGENKGYVAYIYSGAEGGRALKVCK